MSAELEALSTELKRRMPRAGSLARELSKQGVQPKDINSLKIDGELNDEDFILIRNYMPNLVSIDLHDCKATMLRAAIHKIAFFIVLSLLK